MFQHLLHEESILLDLEAPTRNIALKKLVDFLPLKAISKKQKDLLYRALLKRERLGTTAIGDEVALPHSVIAGIAEPIVALGISRQGLDFSALDGEPVYLISLVVLPETEDTAELRDKVLHSAMTFFKDSFLRERLKISQSPEEAYEVILREGEFIFSAAAS